MRLARLDMRLDGEVLARAVLGPDGHLLLVAGARLTPRYIQRLQDRGVEGVYIADDLSADIVPDVALQRETRREAVLLIREAIARAEAQDPRGVPLRGLRDVLEEILDQVWRNQGLAVDLGEVRSNTPYAFSHSLECAVLALLLGESLGLTPRRLRLLGTGVLLQDIGMARYGDLVARPGSLTPAEFDRLKGHTLEGYRFLRQDVGLPVLTAHVALQHHERLDGSGYPRGREGKAVHLFGRIAAVADVYAALRAKRPFREAMPATEAMRTLRGMAGSQLDPEVVRLLSERVAVYGVGTPVLLSSGELAVVVAQGKAGPGLPRVRVIATPALRVCAPWELELGTDPDKRAIRTVLPDYPESILRQLR